ncbi:MAG: NAD(P) transhydrogenase subunit alpha [Rhodospirillaceae bacterium]|nr:NAD(P) transhydrogenase subunit alpha [Rhodospirillaceae bacterium]
MEPNEILNSVNQLLEETQQLAERARELAEQAQSLDVAPVAAAAVAAHGSGFLLFGLTVFMLACFVGYYVVWSVTPALHSPLMSVTNAVSSVIIVGAIIAATAAQSTFGGIMGFLAVVLASVNIFGGFIVTRRMLAMYKKKQR